MRPRKIARKIGEFFLALAEPPDSSNPAKLPPIIEQIGSAVGEARAVQTERLLCIYVSRPLYTFLSKGHWYSRYSDAVEMFIYGLPVVSLPDELQYLFNGGSFFVDEAGKFG